MTRIEFKNYIEEKLNRELFEESAAKSIKEMATENESKTLKPYQEKEMIKQMWNQVIENAYMNVKNNVKKKATEEDWKSKIDELVDSINDSFSGF
ncbi:hypothetical protein [Clostridium cuniculi]|uniref:hypothetical protein n=1 Tax=Clostridium cuniculi TaxID=2548455 RepID=UPI0010551E31|nr:hypothetical protein [Clostridium cuniculi]